MGAMDILWAILVVAVVVIWAWLRRRQVLGILQVNKPATTLPDASFPAVTEMPSGDNAKITLEREQVKQTFADRKSTRLNSSHT